ncbi:MAG: hypothetical protein NUV46_03930 [Nanoarchaeota archaeon]|nr:hypothetical protein [Nanoarchaeota archaeon]
MKNFGLLRKLVEGKEISIEEAKILGTTRNANLKFPFKYVVGNELGEQGSNSIVYLTKNKKSMIAKLNFNSLFSVNNYQILRELKKRGRKVTNPRGMYNVYNQKKKEFNPALIMEYGNSIRVSDLKRNSPEYKDALKKIKKESDKMKKLGWKSFYDKYWDPTNYYNEFRYGIKFENALYDPPMKRLTLIDFDQDDLDTRKLYTNEKGGKEL